MSFVTTARLLYRVAKTCLQLPFADPETQAVETQNQRIGMGVTGIRGAKWTDADYQTVYQELRAEDRRYSVEIGAAESVTLTTVKPSGTTASLFSDVCWRGGGNAGSAAAPTKDDSVIEYSTRNRSPLVRCGVTEI